MIKRPSRPLATVAAAALLALGLPAAASLAADSQRCSDTVADHLAELPLAPGDVKSVRILERVNISDDLGPEIFGVDAWVRLNSCSGWLVINMTPKCYIRQTYTRGDCRVDGVPSY